MEIRKFQVGEMVEFGEQRPVKKLLAVTDHFRSALVCLKEGQSLGPHRTPGDAVLSVISGRARFTVDGQEHEVGRGAIFTIPAGTMHQVLALKDTVAQVAVSLPGGQGHADHE